MKDIMVFVVALVLLNAITLVIVTKDSFGGILSIPAILIAYFVYLCQPNTSKKPKGKNQ